MSAIRSSNVTFYGEPRRLRRVAAGLGYVRVTARMPTEVRIGAVTAQVQRAEYRGLFQDVQIPVPPVVLDSIGSARLTQGTRDELVGRLASVAIVAVLLGDDLPDTDAVAALAFAEHFAGASAIPEGVAVGDYLAWGAVGRSLPRWFNRRFATSRLVLA